MGIVDCIEVSKTYHQGQIEIHALKNIDLSITRGEFVAVAGPSGSGKSTALDTFEDAGFYCVDNMPVALLPIFLDQYADDDPDIPGLVFVMDLREREFLSTYPTVFERLASKPYPYEVIFLEADEKTLLQRYSQTRRNHPLCKDRNSLLDGVRAEKELFENLKNEAGQVIDTSAYSVHDLKSKIFEIVKKNADLDTFRINVLSFGFKYGIPLHADVVMDVRFLPNPYWQEDLRPKSGLEKEVSTYVVDSDQGREFLQLLVPLLLSVADGMAQTGRELRIGIGCTGGRHRSVAVVEALAALREQLPRQRRRDLLPGKGGQGQHDLSILVHHRERPPERSYDPRAAWSACCYTPC